MAKPRVSDADLCRAAKRVGTGVAEIKTFLAVETKNKGFDSQDRPLILFERHVFHKFTQGRFDTSHPDLSNRTSGGYGSSASQYDRFARASALDAHAALLACSWGLGQVMGFNFAIAGYRTVEDFVAAMRESEGKQLDAAIEFVIHNDLDGPLCDHDWVAFARGYNGAGEAEHNYHGLLKQNYLRLSKLPQPDCSQYSAATAVPSSPAVSDATTAPQNIADSTPPTNSDTTDATADTIVNTGDTAQPAPVTGDVTVAAPLATNSVATSTQMTIAGIAVPSFLVGIFKAIESAINSGYIDAREVGDAVIGFLTTNTKYVLGLVGLIIVLLGIKHITRHVTLWAEMFTKARTDLNSVTVTPTDTPK